MAIFRGVIRSDVLDMDTPLQVIVPFDHFDHAAHTCLGHYDKTLVLLHGLRQNGEAWARMSGVERYARDYGYCVVMPDAQRSFYTDMAQGMRFFTYLNEELPWALEKVFRLPMDRLYVGGLSMGGQGAIKCALTYPRRYAGALCLSSGFGMLHYPEQMIAGAFYSREELQGVIGPDLKASPQDDPLALAEQAAGEARKPRIYLACGTEDFLYAANTRMRDHLQALGYDLQYEEWPGIHNWEFWDAGLRRGMAWLAG